MQGLAPAGEILSLRHQRKKPKKGDPYAAPLRGSLRYSALAKGLLATSVRFVPCAQ